MADESTTTEEDYPMFDDVDNPLADAAVAVADPPDLEAPDPEAATPEPEADADQTHSPAAEIDWSKVNPADIPHEIASRTQAFQGVLSDKQQLAAERRELLDLARERRAEPTEPEPAASASPLDDLEDDEQITAGEMRQAMKAERAQWEADQVAKDQRAREDARNATILESQRQLLADPKIAALPPSLHPAVVFKDGLAILKAENPQLVAALANMKDPARELYTEIVRRVPHYRNELAAHRKKSPSPTPPGTKPAPPGKEADDGLDHLRDLAGVLPERDMEPPEDSMWDG